MKRVFLLVFLTTLIGCDARTSQPSAKTAKDIVNNLTYVQDQRSGICYAVVEFAHPGEVGSNSAGITYVPCDKVPAEMLGK